MSVAVSRPGWISPIPGVEANQVGTFFDDVVGFGPAKGKKHGGVDLSVPTGTTIYAPKEGRVARYYSEEAGGNVMVLDHGGYRTVLAHLDSALVKVGDTIVQGQPIAKSGESGVVSGPHLHWEVMRNGLKIDPLDLFDPFASDDPGQYQTSNKLMCRLAVPFVGMNKDWWVEPDAEGNCPIGYIHVDTANQFLDLTNTPLEGVADTVDVTAQLAGALLDPVNWARILALVAGGVLTFVGFLAMWKGSGNNS